MTTFAIALPGQPGEPALFVRATEMALEALAQFGLTADDFLVRTDTRVPALTVATEVGPRLHPDRLWVTAERSEQKLAFAVAEAVEVWAGWVSRSGQYTTNGILLTH